MLVCRPETFWQTWPEPSPARLTSLLATMRKSMNNPPAVCRITGKTKSLGENFAQKMKLAAEL